jgi:hypothetical protein
VAASYSLGRIYLHENRAEDAIKAFSYVAVHGGSSINQKLAAEHLEALGATVPQPEPLEMNNVFFSTKEKIAIYGFSGVCVVLSVILWFHGGY